MATSLVLLIIIVWISGRFATWPVQTDAMTSTGSQASANTFIPIQWLDEVLATREMNLVLSNLFRRINHKGKPGDTLRIPFISDLTANQKTATNPVTIQVLAEGRKDIVLDQHWEVSFLEEDFLKIQSNYSLRKYYAEKAGYALAKKIDYLLATDVCTNVNAAYKVIGSDGITAYNSGSGGNQADITDAGLRRIIQTLDENDVPEDGRFLVIPPSQKNALLGIDKFTLFQNIGRTQEIQKGTFGSIYGLTVYVTNNCYTTGSAKVAICGHKEGAAVAIQQDVRFQTQYKLENLAWLCVSDCIFGTKVLRGDAADTTNLNLRKSHIVTVYVP